MVPSLSSVANDDIQNFGPSFAIDGVVSRQADSLALTKDGLFEYFQVGLTFKVTSWLSLYQSKEQRIIEIFPWNFSTYSRA